MTVLEQMARTVSDGDTEWAQLVAARTTTPETVNGAAWGRKGGSWAKEGDFYKK